MTLWTKRSSQPGWGVAGVASIASGLRLEVFAGSGAAFGPGIELAGTVFRAKLVVGLMHVARQAAAQLLALPLLLSTRITAVHQLLKIALAELPEQVAGLCGQFSTQL